MSAKAYDKKTAAFAGFLLQNIPECLTSKEMSCWIEDPIATKKFLKGLILVESEGKLLEFIAYHDLPDVEEFVVKEKFVVNLSDTARVRISSLALDSISHETLSRKRQNIRLPGLLVRKRLLKATDTSPRFFAMDGEERAHISLYEFYEVLAFKQANKQFDMLAGYIRDDRGKLDIIRAYWEGNGWFVADLGLYFTLPAGNELLFHQRGIPD